MKYNTKDLKFALDIGTRSIIGTVGIYEENKFKVIYEKYIEHEERAMVDGQISDVSLVSKGVEKVVGDINKTLDIKLEEVYIAAAGRFLRTYNSKIEMAITHEDEISADEIRSLELMAVKKAEDNVVLKDNSKLYCVGYSVVNYYLNDFLISNLKGQKGEKVAVEVIATFLPRSVVDSLYTVLNKVGLKVKNITLEPIAAIEAAVPKKFRLLNIGLIDVGAGTSDIAISSNESIVAYGMVPLAGDEVTEAIASELLIDFNAAEEVKRNIANNEEVTYMDILGFENTIKSTKVLRAIKPVVKKIAVGICDKLLELNGDKPTSAIFLVGGGAYTPGLKEEIVKILKLQPQRIAIKDRSGVIDCVSENVFGSAGVTVLGIGLVGIKSDGQDFIDIYLNGEPVSMFNTRTHSVQDVVLQAAIDPSLLIGKKGKTLHYILNGNNRIAFGELGNNAVIKINDNLSSLEEKVREGDKIEIEFAKNGKAAELVAKDLIVNFNTMTIYIDSKIYNLEPMIFINNEKASFEQKIEENDNVKIFIPRTIGEVKKYVLENETSLYLDKVLLEDNFEIIEELYLYTKLEKLEIEKDEEVMEEKAINSIEVNINGKIVTLKGKDIYNFIEVFNYIDIDTSNIKGTVELKLNGEEASYMDELKNGDLIEVSIK